MTSPTVTIVVANYNGRAHLERCLPSLDALEYPRDQYRVVVVDDASTDNSTGLLAARFPWVEVIRSARNRGFAGATNLGFTASNSAFVVALNNDIEVRPSWLRELLQPALDDPTVGLCTGKLILTRDRLRVRLAHSHDCFAAPRLPRAAWLDNWPAPLERVGFPNSTYLEIGVAVEAGHRPRELRLELDEEVGTNLEIALGGCPTRPITVDPDRTVHAAVEVDTIIRPVVQNAGLVVFRDGRGRDRGAVAGPGVHYYADDVGQFERTEEVFAGCGASLLIRAGTLADVGAFDERFFTYYEDVDLSWRARLRGWRVVYCHRAVASHAHRGTTGEWSNKFVYYTERNRLMLLVKVAPGDRVLTQLGRTVLSAGWASLVSARRIAQGRDPMATGAAPRWAGLGNLCRLMPSLLATRARIQARRRVPQSAIDRWLLDEDP